MKFTIWTLLCVSISGIAHSQTTHGFKVGINYATQVLSNEPVNSYSDAIFGYHFGWTGSVTITSSLTFRPEFLLSKKGQLEKITPPYFKGYSYLDKIYYVESPLVCSLDLGKTKNKGFFLTAGMYVALGVSGKSIYHNNNTNTSETRKVIFQSDMSSPNSGDLILKRHDIGLVSGLGFRTTYLTFDFTHNLGFTNIHTKTSSDDRMSAKNLVLKFGVSYIIKKTDAGN